MPVSTHRKSQIVGITDQLTGLALRVGVPAVIAALVFLAVVLFGGHMRGLAKMSLSDRNYLLQSIALATQALVLGSGVVAAAVVLRCSRFEETGQVMSLAGAALCFGAPVLLAATVTTTSPDGNAVLLKILQALRTAGGIVLVPGLVLVLRDGILRIWNGMSVKRVMARRYADAEQRRRRRVGKLLPKCWDMDCCREFVRKICPAWTAKKACWKIKTGCCDETVILKALAAGGMDKDNIHAQGIMASLGIDKPADTRFTRKIRAARCKRCYVYSRHQADKYRLLSPMVFPAVLLLLYAYYGRITAWLWVGFEKTDRFMSFLTFKHVGSTYALGNDGYILTALTMVWLALIGISYALRALEYFVFELQV
jgi:hypothetical protein